MVGLKGTLLTFTIPIICWFHEYSTSVEALVALDVRGGGRGDNVRARWDCLRIFSMVRRYDSHGVRD